jgi:hypothetical protein
MNNANQSMALGAKATVERVAFGFKLGVTTFSSG